MNLFLFVLLAVQIHSVAPVIHSVKYFGTTTSQVPNFPEFVSVGYVDEVQISHYDSNSRKAEPKQAWMNKITAEDPRYWQTETETSVGNEQRSKVSIENMKKRFNQTGELPEVYLLQKTPSSPVSCFATGFYPDGAIMFWRKDGEELHEDVEHGELLPNHDGTFQMAVDLKVEVAADVEGKYECVFQLAGVKEDMVTKLERKRILSNASLEDNSSLAITVTLALLAAAAILAAIIFLVWRCKDRPAKYDPASGDGDFKLSENLKAGISVRHSSGHKAS
ncbi:major histocompatibility complex class I-related gene protein-like isoform X3 [Dunckerocampus dactyliophorus]|uniref:major histocompatibility complex class I-related gene protein-like isoform X3 n=1 Tax=Dunckerocampus dactyliophorus TaxID=161453 RepID=UPI0024062A22|nr:major histocompatibility complex class I-related gene protein-like isoform X3 [Dunckerocampus dactyliophorus]